MNFSTVSRVQQTLRASDEVEWTRGTNRVKINNAANCAPPLPIEEAKKLNIRINVNWGELMILLSHARRQYMTAFWSQRNFFKVSLPQAPKEMQSEWGAMITETINRIMRNSLSYFEVHRSKWAAVTCHGPGPTQWRKRDRWLPDFVAIEDLRIPTDTTVDFKNLNYFAVRHIYTPFELLDEAFNNKKSNPWDLKAVAGILKNYKEVNYDYAPNHYDWETTAEKLAELVKQDGGYYASDAMPGIPLWHFYFEDNTDARNKGWFMRIVPEEATVRGTPENDRFLWTNDEPVAPTWQQIIHCQHGDLSNKAPFMYHSERSLGYALLEPCFYTNLTRCRMLQHLNDNFDVWLRITDPAEKARAQMQEFGNYKVLKSGVSVVPQTERHQVEADLVEMAMAQLKQLQQEASSSYTQQTDTGTKKEQTAFETSVKLQQVNAMMGGLLMTAFVYESHSYREICRRFCLRKTEDPDIQLFQKRCQEAKIPLKWLNVDLWDVDPVTPLGMGNPAMAQSEAQQLWQARGAYNAEAQQEILHECTLVWTGDARKAARWAPLGQEKQVSSAARDAMAMFSTLMLGVPVPPKQDLPPIDQIEALLPLMAGVIVKIEKRDKTGTPDEIAGLMAVHQYITELIQALSTDPEQAQRVRAYSEDLNKLMDQVKGLAQRGQEKQAKQNGNGLDPAAMAKIQGTMATTQAKLKGKAAMDKQKMQQDNQRFTREQRRKDAETFADIQRQGVETETKARRMRSMEE